MKNELSLFQIIILAIFGIFAIVGVIYFARGTYGTSGNEIGNVLIWGTLDERAFAAVLRTVSEDDERLRAVVYEQKDARTFQQDLANAIASGAGPDLIVLSHENILKDQDKLMAFPESAVSERQFKETFVDGADIFITNQGIMGIPISVDPIVMYVNKDILGTAGFAKPPVSWNEVFDVAERATRKDDSKNIVKSGVAFGTYENVTHAKEIVTTLIMQAGNPITEWDTTGVVRSTVAANDAKGGRPAESALRFFTEFANPSKIVYSWNRALPESRTAFGQDTVALYMGFASEYVLLRQQNPNLNFSIAMIPQIKDTGRATTFGRMYAFAIPRASQNPTGALSAALILAGSEPSRLLWMANGLASPRRDVLSTPVEGESAAEAVVRDSAIIAHAWLDPDPIKTGAIFKGMIDDAISGAARLSEAVQRVERELTSLLDIYDQ